LGWDRERGMSAVGTVTEIPRELRERRQWVTWRIEQRDGKPTKVPYQCDGRRRASATDPPTWATFEQVADATDVDGIGFVFAKDDPFVGIDLDDCREPDTGYLRGWAVGYVQLLDSYTEASPSGTGVKVWVRGQLPVSGKRKEEVEIYSSGRFFTVTGEHVVGTPAEIQNRQLELDAISNVLFPLPSPNGRPARPAQPVDIGDEELLARMFAASNGDRIGRLWAGDISAHHSHSEADAALCAHLAWWTNRDTARMDSLFRRSGLMREKWDKRRGESTYGGLEIANAIARTSSGYTGEPPPPSPDPSPVLAPDLPRNPAPEARSSFLAPFQGGGGAELLDATVEYVKRFVILTAAQYDAVALWAMHTHAIDAAEATPYLGISSPEKESGKTRLQEALELIVHEPLSTTNISEPALFRSIELRQPTVLFDEIDAIFAPGSNKEDLRSMLNAGHRRGRTIQRCVGDGSKMKVVAFRVFCAKAFGLIGELPETVASRTIPIRMKRKARHETVERWRERDIRPQAEPLRDALAAWAEANDTELLAARPELPEELSDRQQDGWEPLLAIADLAGEDWPKRARRAALALAEAPDINSQRIELLGATRSVFEAAESDRLPTNKLIELLAADEESPYVTWWNRDHKDGPRPHTFAPGLLAKMLGHYEISSKQVWYEGKNSKGYERSAFEDTWSRYL
jgi:putative DNA primase/helicase